MAGAVSGRLAASWLQRLCSPVVCTGQRADRVHAQRSLAPALLALSDASACASTPGACVGAWRCRAPRSAALLVEAGRSSGHPHLPIHTTQSATSDGKLRTHPLHARLLVVPDQARQGAAEQPAERRAERHRAGRAQEQLAVAEAAARPPPPAREVARSGCAMPTARRSNPTPSALLSPLCALAEAQTLPLCAHTGLRTLQATDKGACAQRGIAVDRGRSPPQRCRQVLQLVVRQLPDVVGCAPSLAWMVGSRCMTVCLILPAM